MTGPLRELPGQDDPRYQTWVMLLNGYGYNWYRLDNQLHADDLLIRSQASDHLAAAATRLREIEANYRRTHIPPPSREQPSPDPAHVAAARRLRAVSDRIAELDTRIRGAALPPNDMVSMRHRDHLETLMALSQSDVVLIGAARDLATLAADLPSTAAIDDEAEERIDDHVAYLNAALARRRDLLA